MSELPENDRRPQGRLEATETFGGVTPSVQPTSDAERCNRCHRPLSRQSSIDAGLGPRCKRAVDLLEDFLGRWSA